MSPKPRPAAPRARSRCVFTLNSGYIYIFRGLIPLQRDARVARINLKAGPAVEEEVEAKAAKPKAKKAPAAAGGAVAAPAAAKPAPKK